MKIVYMGTPPFAVPPLCKLVEAGHEIVAVITQPDKKKDRGKKVQLTPVKEAALSLELTVWQPERIKGNAELVAGLAALGADCFVVAAYGQILPKEILDIPPMGCINIHGSLLPKYRGAAPVHRAILDGEPVTGVTIMQMDEGLDTGDMLSCARTEVGRKTAALLYDELSEMGAALLVDTLRALREKAIKPVRQDNTLACYAPMLTKEEGRMDFSKTAVELERQVRGMNPWPSAYTVYKDLTVKIWEAELELEEEAVDAGGEIAMQEQNGADEQGSKTLQEAGTILRADRRGIAISTGEGILLITKLQFPGKKAVSVKDYLLGNQIEIGVVLREGTR